MVIEKRIEFFIYVLWIWFALIGRKFELKSYRIFSLQFLARFDHYSKLPNEGKGGICSDMFFLNLWNVFLQMVKKCYT